MKIVLLGAPGAGKGTVAKLLTEYDGSVRLALAKDAGPDTEKSHETIIRGWRRYAPRLTTWQCSGNHMSILKEPEVDALAQWVLEGMQQRGGE